MDVDSGGPADICRDFSNTKDQRSALGTHADRDMSPWCARSPLWHTPGPGPAQVRVEGPYTGSEMDWTLHSTWSTDLQPR